MFNMFALAAPLLLARFHKSQKKKKMLSFKGIIEVKHSLPGRVRYYIPRLCHWPKTESFIETLKGFDSIDAAAADYRTGSLLITYKNMDQNLLTGVIIELLDLHEELEKPVVGKIYKESARMGKALDRAIYEESQGFLDLDSLISLSLGVLALVSIIKNPKIVPGGWTLLWWYYNAAHSLGNKDKDRGDS